MAAPRPTTRRSSVSSPASGGTAAVLGGRAPRGAARGRARERSRRAASTAAAGSISSSSPTRVDADVSVVSVMAVNNEVGSITDRRRGRPRRAARRIPMSSCTPTRCRPRRGSTCARSPRTSICCRCRPTSSAGRRASACWCAATGVGTFEPLSSVAGRSASAAAARRTSPVPWQWPRRCGSTDVERDAENVRIAALRDRLVDRLRAQLPDVRETVRPIGQGGRLGTRLHPRRRERGAAVPARRGRRVRQRRVGVRGRCDGAVARAGRHGRRPRVGGRRVAADARAHHHDRPTSTGPSR